MPKRNKKNIAITGTNLLIGNILLSEISKNKSIDKIIVLDNKKPDIVNKKILFKKIDFTKPASVPKSARTLKKNRCEIFLHTALLDSPLKNGDLAHEIQAIGTMHILLACEKANTQKLILASTTEVYGALPDNPSFLNEGNTPRGYLHSTYLKDKIDAENQFLRFQKRFPEKTVTILRPCTILGPDIRHFKANFLKQQPVPTVLGFDPIIQFLHIEDMKDAFFSVIENNFPGIFNIVGDGVMPLSRILKLAEKTNLPIFEPVMKLTTDLLWYLDIAPAASGHIEFLKYQCVANGKKSETVMNFQPKFSIEETILSFRYGKKEKQK